MKKEKIDAFVWYGMLAVLFICLLYFNIGFGVLMQPEKQKQNIDSITVEEMKYEDTFYIRRMDKCYTVDGEASYEIKFRASELGTEITCQIPESLQSKIDENAKYDAVINLMYSKEYYEQLGKSKDVQDKIKDNHAGFTVKSIDFMFSDYIETEFESEQKALETIKTQLYDLYN